MFSNQLDILDNSDLMSRDNLMGVAGTNPSQMFMRQYSNSNNLQTLQNSNFMTNHRKSIDFGAI